jgi:hypothetical protein
MLGHQPLESFEIFNGQPTPLNYLRSKHPRFLAHVFAGSQRKKPNSAENSAAIRPK